MGDNHRGNSTQQEKIQEEVNKDRTPTSSEATQERFIIEYKNSGSNLNFEQPPHTIVLPVEIWTLIFILLDGFAVIASCRTCKTFARIINTETLIWQSLVESIKNSLDQSKNYLPKEFDIKYLSLPKDDVSALKEKYRIWSSCLIVTTPKENPNIHNANDILNQSNKSHRVIRRRVYYRLSDAIKVAFPGDYIYLTRAHHIIQGTIIIKKPIYIFGGIEAHINSTDLQFKIHQNVTFNSIVFLGNVTVTVFDNVVMHYCKFTENSQIHLNKGGYLSLVSTSFNGPRSIEMDNETRGLHLTRCDFNNNFSELSTKRLLKSIQQDLIPGIKVNKKILSEKILSYLHVTISDNTPTSYFDVSFVEMLYQLSRQYSDSEDIVTAISIALKILSGCSTLIISKEPVYTKAVLKSYDRLLEY